VTSSRECEAIGLFCGKILEQGRSPRKSFPIVLLPFTRQADRILLEPHVLLVVHSLMPSDAPPERNHNNWRHFGDKAHQAISGISAVGMACSSVVAKLSYPDYMILDTPPPR
jgi:hypothetical protein